MSDRLCIQQQRFHPFDRRDHPRQIVVHSFVAIQRLAMLYACILPSGCGLVRRESMHGGTSLPNLTTGKMH
jgi:hypothetical protein